MKNPKVKFVLDGIEPITRRDPNLTSEKAVERAVCDAVGLAEKMARKASKHLERVLDQPTTAGMQSAWNADTDVKRYFGKAPTKAKMRKTCDRLNRVHQRLRDKSLTIRIKPQSGTDNNGHNYGGPLSPRKFVLFPKWFSHGAKQRAAIIVHELLHDRHIDHKVKDPVTGERVIAYGDDLARELAREKPGNARKNPENFEQFCLAVW